MFLKTVFNMR